MATPQTWFVTGCTSGFGASFVRQLREAGDNVVAAGRNVTSRLSALAGDPGVALVDLDVTWPADKIASAVQRAWAAYPGGIDVVVNNAGSSIIGAFEEMSETDIERGFRVLLFGPMNVTRAVLPMMRARGTGTLIFMSSVRGWDGSPGGTAYSSPKFALEGWVEVLNKELGMVAPALRVHLIEPGTFATEIFRSAERIPARISDYAAFRDFVDGVMNPILASEHLLGDIDAAVLRTIEFAKCSGTVVAQCGGDARLLPLRLPLGSDSLDAVRAKCEQTLALCREWGDVARSTDRAYDVEKPLGLESLLGGGGLGGPGLETTAL